MEEIFLARIERKLNWEEAELYTEPIEGFGKGMTVKNHLRFGAKNKLQNSGKVTEADIKKVINEIKAKFPFGVIKSYSTIRLLKKDDEYFNLTQMKAVESDCEICNLILLSEYAVENEFKIEEENGEFALYLEDEIFEKIFE